MTDQTLIVKDNKGVEIARGTLPDLDGDHGKMAPDEASGVVFNLTAGGSLVTLEELSKKHRAASIEYDKVVSGRTDRVVKKGAEFQKFVKLLGEKKAAYVAFQKEIQHAVTITIPAAKDIDPVTKLGKKKPEEHPIHPLKQFAGRTINLNIPIPTGHDFHKWTPELSERVMKALDEATEYPEDVRSALKIAAQDGTLGPLVKVHFGFVDTDLGKVYGEAQVRKAEKAEKEEAAEGTGDGEEAGGGTPHTSDPHFSGLNFANAVSSFHAAISFVSRLASRLSELCDSLIIALAGGDVDALAMLMDVQAGIENILASKSGIETARNKGKLRAQIEKLRRKNEETQGKYRKLLAEVNQNPKDSAKAAKLAELESTSKRTEYLIQDAQAFLQVMDQFVNTQLQAGQDAQRMAQTIRYKLDNGRRS